MVVLGINGGVRMGYQDIAAALVVDGRVVAAVEEERLNRIKHSPGRIPQESIQAVLDIAGLEMQEVDLVVSHGSTWGIVYETILAQYLIRHFGHSPKIERIHHHIAHAASAYYPSGMDEAMILTMDASGDGIALQKAVGKDGALKMIEQISRTNSLGVFYSMMSQFCGFVRDTDEYKLMGLAPYGNPAIHELDPILEIVKGGYIFHPGFMKVLEPGAAQPTRQQAIYGEKLTTLLGEERRPGSPMSQKYMDVAASTQRQLTDAIISVVKDFAQATGLRKLCLAGGVALNCAANKEIMNLDFIDELFVQPASGDNGIALGAALWGAQALGDELEVQGHTYLGKSWTNDEIAGWLKRTGSQAVRTENPALHSARLVSEGKVVAWFQGREEFGPRALGNRSILASPQLPEMKSELNSRIKFRESFRPFCPSVLEEDMSEYFVGKQKYAPYMTINYDVRPGLNLPSITHVDQTARVQTVNQVVNPLFYQYLCELKNLTGHGISINTSFNRNREPIVHSPLHALSAYFGSGMDALIMGNYILEK
ncbi:MAG: hypothetical protein GY751_25250 [Bacteroidetes bacterium]|nr:hypothetical protein [Bacteroidota bacterium]